MTRKPQQSGPTAEDISRHEEAVAAYLARYNAADAAKPELGNVMLLLKDVPISERLVHILGRYHMQYSDPGYPNRKELANTIANLMAMIRSQIWLEDRGPSCQQPGPS